MSEQYYVEIVAYTGEVVQRMGPHPLLSTADRIQRGASINLNHEKYFTRIVSE